MSGGAERLTTTRVAVRAGVSVGTLYQYFPNKGALLKAALQRHLEEITEVVEQECKRQEGGTLQQMATALIQNYLQAKIKDGKASVALYSVSSNVDGAAITYQMGLRFRRAIAGMLETSCEPLTKDPDLVASVIQSVMAGVSRALLESEAPEKEITVLQQELIVVSCAYLKVCSVKS